ncbi:MAG TPA: MlaD family protein [Gemmatimonadaceae bacterium]|jgi:phospholipid/cholesterol/gamma-HCH transport system substrate-binding protein|nr:MlaD family protein [Gemmatimonadaceae bacterium]
MPRPLAWRQLVPGVVILAVITLAALAVLVFARVGALHGDTYRLYVLSDDARGVISGTEVWLAGQKIGAVRDISFRPVTSDSLGRLAVALDILDRYKPAIRGDSRAEFRSGSTPIGATIVSISIGSPGKPMLEADDTIPRARQIDPDSVRAALSSAASQIPALLDDADTLIHTFRRALGSSAGDSTPRLGVIADRLTRLARRMDAGGGTISRFASDTLVTRRMDRISDRARALMGALDSSDNTLGRAVNDSAISRAIADVRSDIDTLRAQLTEERGTAGRILYDDAILRQLRLLQDRLDDHDEIETPPSLRGKP